MRTLKKTLCLVLVLVMMVGLLAVGASAVTINDYKDKDEITHPEAVATLTAIGVLQGDDKGTFRPTATLTRAEGATFITKLSGTTGAGTSTFTDMAGYDWAQPAVAYCEKAGIMAGVGGGLFAPGAPMTNVQWAKMLLGALGYDATREGLIGSQWEINTIKLVNSINLAEDILDFDWNAPVTRDNAAQFALNTLKATMREYDGYINVTTPDGTAVNIEGTSDPVPNKSYSYNGVTDNEMQFVENYYPRLKLLNNGNGTGKYGEFTATWFTGDDRSDNVWTPIKTVSSEMTGTVIKTYTEGLARVTLGTVASDAGFILPTTVYIYENGVNTAHPSITKASTASLKDFAGGEATLIKKGSEYRLIVKYPYLATVTGITSAAESTTKNRQVTLKVWNNTTGVTGVTFDTENFAKKDVVLVYPTGAYTDTTAVTDPAVFSAVGAIKDVLAADSVTGNLSNRGYFAGALSSLTIDGISYGIAANAFYKLPAGDPAINKPITAYVSNGYTMGYLAGDVTATDYVYVLGAAIKGSSALGDAAVVEVGYMKQDGTTAVVDSTVTATTTAVNSFISNNAGKWNSVSKSGGKFSFTVAPTSDSEAIYEKDNVLKTDTDGKYILKSTQPTIATDINTNNNTVFLIRSGSANTVAVYTGINNVPSFKATAAATAQALIVKSTGTAAAVYINFNGENPAGATTAPIFIVSNSKTSETVNEDGDALRGYSYINTETGKLDTVTTIGSVTVNVGLNIPEYDKNGYAESLGSVTEGKNNVVIANKVQSATDMKFSGGVLTVASGSAFAVADDAVAYIYNASKGTLIVGDASDLVDRAGTLSAVQASSTDSHLKTLYLIIT